MPGRFYSPRLTLVFAALLSSIGPTQARGQTELADLREDVHGLSQRVNELTLRVEQLEHENSELQAKVARAEGNKEMITAAQLNGAVADINASIASAVAASRSEILQQVATQMEVLDKQTNAALDSLAKAGPAPQVRTTAATPIPKPAFGDTYSKEGVSYTVAKGDTVGLIAKKTGAKAQDIIDANKLLDPSRIQAGQVLFIPGGK